MRSIKPRLDLPQFQTADTLLKFRFGIPKIDSFLGLASTDLCCVNGYKANLILTRLCVRALLQARHGGLSSPYVMIADTGNRTDVYSAINIARQYGMNKEKTAERILVTRAFTVSQVRKLLSVEVPRIIQHHQVNCVVVPGLLNTIDEEQTMRIKEAKREIGRIMKAMHELSHRILVITSIQEGKYTKEVLREFTKRIDLKNAKHGRIDAELNNRGTRKTISLTSREIAIIPRK
ncbi:MAG TPA: hypothetical protein VGE97_11115 [Nitrososphaera sp.]